MNNRPKSFYLALFVLLALATAIPAYASTGTQQRVDITEMALANFDSDAQGVHFTLQTPPLTVDAAGQVTVAGLDSRTITPGTPDLPIYSTLIAVPPSADVQVAVTPLVSSVTDGIDVAPVVDVADKDGLTEALAEGGTRSLEAFGLAAVPDDAIYSQDAAYPGLLYTVSDPMHVRDLRVVRLTLYPVQVNPVARQVTQAQELAVSVRFDGAAFDQARPAPSRSDALVSAIAGQVLNAEAATNPAWRSLPQATQNAAATDLPVGGTAYKILVDEDGIYELSYAYLQSIGMPVNSVNPNTFEMNYRGEPVAYQFVGDGDSNFETGEAIRFFGWRYDVDYTDPAYNSSGDHVPNRVERQHIANALSTDSSAGGVNVFWLWAGGTRTSITSKSNQLGYPAVTDARVSVTSEFDNNQHPSFSNDWDTFPNEPDSWYWTRMDVTKTRSFTVPDPKLSGDSAELLVEFLSVDTGVHQVSVALQNSTPATSVVTRNWTGRQSINAVGNVPANLLRDGSNTLLFTPQSANSREIHMHRVSVEYDRLLRADDNMLYFKDLESGSKRYDISGFGVGSSSSVLAWDVTNRNAPVAINVTSTAVSGSGPYTYKIGNNSAAGTRLIVANTSGVKTPLGVDDYNVVNLNPSGGAEWLAIAHGSLEAKTETRLATYRQSAAGGAFSTHVVDVADVINQYGYGLPVPTAIQDYIHHAMTWSTAPTYVTLVGDASANTRDWYCSDCDDMVPTNLLFVDRWQGQIPTDHPYATPDGLDDIPDVAVGRMTVKTTAALDNIIDKIEEYESAGVSRAAWTEDVLFVADNTDDGGDFCTANLALDQTFINGAFNTEHLCLDDYSPNGSGSALEQLRADMQAELTAGTAIFNYRGHGAITHWAEQEVVPGTKEYLLNMDEPYINTWWQNSNKPTVLVSADCLDGNFTFFKWNGSSYADVPALSETFLEQQDVGTVAHWSSTGLGFNDEHTYLHEELYDAYLVQGVERLGDMIVYSKFRYINDGAGHISEVYAFTLQGDPALQMPVQTPEPNGDVSCDNATNVVDALFVLQYDVQLRGAAYQCPLPANTMYLPACDTNSDSLCNVVDALFLLQCDVGINNVFCPPVFSTEASSAID